MSFSKNIEEINKIDNKDAIVNFYRSHQWPINKDLIFLEFKYIKKLINNTLEKSKELALPNLGFDPLSDLDLISFLTNPKQFSLKLNKIKGKGIFYGLDHVSLRQNLLNRLPIQLKNRIIYQKLKFNNLDEKIVQLSNIQHIKSCEDIGMGHSVYRVIGKKMSFVVKRVDHINQEFYNKILSILEMPFHNVFTVNTNHGRWEVSDNLGDITLTKFCLESNELSPAIVKQLARHACLGDVFGRGDRHSENYMVKDNVIYSIDNAFLFYKNNNQWVERYIQGCQSEISIVCNLFNEINCFKENLNIFLEEYKVQYQRIKQRQSMIVEWMKCWFENSIERENNIRYIKKTPTR
ncbi:hypothetical protein DID75_00675 [Candidatus Marinamargulisbacteria bacterium SCGC AG-410-N11]|nr:hypothetical protein DID75_00675 [Candidatus Marinamargulisbacteria bacterium SCGC AG-410-N11]